MLSLAGSSQKQPVSGRVQQVSDIRHPERKLGARSSAEGSTDANITPKTCYMKFKELEHLHSLRGLELGGGTIW